MRVRLTPSTVGVSGTKTFEVKDVEYDTAKGELTLGCRDGRICLGLQGSWQMAIGNSFARPMSCDEAEREHEGRALVMVN